MAEMAALETSKKKNSSREGKFTHGEKCDLADIICNEEIVPEGEPGKPIIVKLCLKSIANKEKAALYKWFLESL